MKFKTGDYVFAKVKGFVPWPAKVTSTDVTDGSEKFSVVFFGTDEFANVSVNNLWIFSDVFKAKFATTKNMKKAKFAKAMFEAVNEVHKAGVQSAGEEAGVQSVGEKAGLDIVQIRGDGFEKENSEKEGHSV